MPPFSSTNRPPERPKRQKVTVFCDPDLMQEFKDKFGDVHGVLTYTFEIAMRELLELTQGQPSNEELIRAAVKNHVLRLQMAPRA